MYRLGGLSTTILGLLSGHSAVIKPTKPHHTTNGFRNIHAYDEHGFLDFLKWCWERKGKLIPGPEAYHFPLAANDPAFLRGNHDRRTLTWIGHATMLFQLGGKNILTDPQFSERASPVQWVGPRRVVAPGLALAALPPIDMVVISHDHYDSLDRRTIEALRDRAGGAQTHFLVPLGLKRWFKSLGITRVVELDWGDEYALDPLRITPVPVQHWSKRGLFGRNRTLWAGWVIQSLDFRFFFAGDSGYTPHFQEIGQHWGPFDLAAIPIGAYEPRWLMAANHLTPEEALQVHQEVGAKQSVAIHWGTFTLTDEPLDEPPRRLEQAKAAAGVAAAEFVVLEHGETIILN